MHEKHTLYREIAETFWGEPLKSKTVDELRTIRDGARAGAR